MSSAQAPPLSRRWPPLITEASLPIWVSIRDILLTLLAWCFLGFLLRNPIHLAYDYLRHPIFTLTKAQPPDLGLLWSRLRFFVDASMALIALLTVTGMINYRRRMAAKHSPQPRALSMAEQAERFDLDEHALVAAWNLKIVAVQFRDDGAIVSLHDASKSIGSAAAS